MLPEKRDERGGSAEGSATARRSPSMLTAAQISPATSATKTRPCERALRVVRREPAKRHLVVGVGEADREPEPVIERGGVAGKCSLVEPFV